MKRRTKILATISDLKAGEAYLKSLIEEGVSGFRMNTAHQSPEDTLAVTQRIRKISPNVPIVVDTKGPEVRTTELKDGTFSVFTGERIVFAGEPEGVVSKEKICVNYEGFHKDVSVGDRVLYDDGDIAFVCVEKRSDAVVCEVLNEGVIDRKKSVNVPGVKLSLASLTEKDKEYVKFSAKHNIDYIAHSFIRNKEDLLAVQEILDEHGGENVRLIAKIENQEGVDNIEEILDHCAGIMVARGDLAIEIPAEKVPPIQKVLIKKAIKKRKLVITATQMLHTMIKNPRPTRAEISDIANAVYDGSSCLMLSGETAYGEYPVEAVRIMSKVVKEVEAVQKPIRKTTIETLPGEAHAFLAKSAIEASLQVPVKAIITDTLTGRTARFLSAFRGRIPVYALCYDESLSRHLGLFYGVFTEKVSLRKGEPSFSEKLQSLVDSNELSLSDVVVLLSGNYDPEHGSSRLEVTDVKNLLSKSSKEQEVLEEIKVKG